MKVRKIKISKPDLKDNVLYLFDEEGRLIEYKQEDNEVKEEEVKADSEETELLF